VIDPNTLVMETARLLRPTLGEQIEIEAMLEENVWHAIADPAQLTTALLNPRSMRATRCRMAAS